MDDRLRLRVTATGEPLPRLDEVRRARREAEERAAAEAAVRREAETRTEALEAEVTRLRHELARREEG